MFDTDKFRQGEVPPEQEDALESVAGGKFSQAHYDVELNMTWYTCPVCGGSVTDYGVSGAPLKCKECGRQFRFNGLTLVEE